ncbi:MAG: gliding motility-associated C-terminal domain-containing protein, partial [Vicingaceae bacterium]
NYETVAGTYTDTLQSVNGCDSIVSQTLNVDVAPIVNLGNDTTFCSGNSLTLDAGAGATSYQWMNGITPPFHNQTFTVNTTGTYFVTATIGVCSTTDSVDVVVIQPIYTNLIDVNICDGGGATIFGNYQTTAGTYRDTLTSIYTGCDSILVQQLIVHPNLTTNDTLTICLGESVFVGGALQTNAGTYYDTLQTTASCDSLIITELEIINSYTTNLFDTICEGESTFVGGGFQTVSGLYYDLLQAQSGCDSLIITNLLVTPKPTVIVTADPDFIVIGGSSQLNATGGGTYSWTPANDLSCTNCANPIATPKETTIYTVVVDSNGCEVSDTVSITLDDEFFIPDGFSPNGDGVNDVFEIVGLAKYPNAQITIINRWGSKVFEANPYLGDWNGTNQFGVSFGDKLPTGTYFYILNLGKENPAGDQEIKGYIYLNE